MAITITVEDGTGLDAANSYATLQEFKGYFADRSIDVTSYDDALVNAALFESAIYIDMRFGASFGGFKLSATQGLEFPREGLFDRSGNAIEGLPADIKTCAILYAHEQLKGTLYPAAVSTAKEVKKQKTTVGPITKEVEYQGVASQSGFLSFPLADALCKKFTASGASGSGQGRVIR